MKEKKIKDRYLLIRPTWGRGKRQVWLALDLWEGKREGGKFLAPLDERGEREAAILKRLNHPAIPELFGGERKRVLIWWWSMFREKHWSR